MTSPHCDLKDRYARLTQHSPDMAFYEPAVQIAEAFDAYRSLQRNCQPRAIPVLDLQQIAPVTATFNELAIVLQNPLWQRLTHRP